jgi:hypothetical protein
VRRNTNTNNRIKTSKLRKLENVYEQVSLGLFDVLKEDKSLYKNCTPNEWISNNSTDIQLSNPALKNSYDFLVKELSASFKAANLKKDCSSNDGILKIQDYLKKNLGSGKPAADTNKNSTAANPVSAPPVTPVTPTSASPSTPGSNPTTNPTTPSKRLYIEKNKIKPFEDILKSMKKFHSVMKEIFVTPVYQRMRLILNCIRFSNKEKKTKEDLQLTITNFISNHYKILDKGIDEFIDRIVAVFCDKDKNMSKALDKFNEYNSGKDIAKKHFALGQFFGFLVLSISK